MSTTICTRVFGGAKWSPGPPHTKPFWVNAYPGRYGATVLYDIPQYSRAASELWRVKRYPAYRVKITPKTKGPTR